MSSPLPDQKRRKLNPANVLRKPFVSPMRAPNSTTPLRENKSKANTLPYTPSTLAHTIKPAYPSSKPTQPRTATPNPKAHQTIKSTPLRRQPAPTWSSSKTVDPEVAAAQKAVTALEIQIKKVQTELDTYKQAGQLLNSTTDADLEALVDKWRVAAQGVAEELFGQVKERIQRMGGVAAWREMETRKYERSHGMGEFAQPVEEESDDADCEFDSEGEELPEEEQEHRKKMKRQAKQEMMDAAEPPDEPEQDPNEQKTKVWEEGGQDDDTFTMDMMLRSLGIDLAVIGYDKEMQRWIA